MQTVTLNASEVAALDKQDPRTKGDGGCQSLMVGLQSRVDRITGSLVLTATIWNAFPATPSTTETEVGKTH